MIWDGLSPPYSTIVADPPWRYTKETNRDSRIAEAHYSTMRMEDVLALPVRDLVADDAYLFLWVTTPRLYGDRNGDGPDPGDILQAWGFRYTTTVTWVKTGRLGMGWHFRVQTEHALLGVRGRASIPPDKRRTNVLVAASEGHSAKPPSFLDMVEETCPGPYLELFCRQPRFGWDSWGRGYERATTGNE